MNELQQVWRDLSELDGYGFLVWDVMEVVGEPHASQVQYYLECSDGSYILIQCYHYWTRERAEAFYNDSGLEAYQSVTRIPG
jgi:hypothetical protein